MSAPSPVSAPPRSSDVRIEKNPKWIRGMVDGRLVVDSRRSLLVWEVPYYPAWYFPIEDLHAGLRANGTTVSSTSRGEGTRFDIVVRGPASGGQTVIADAATKYLDSHRDELRGLVRVDLAALDAWFEEDVEVFVHPRDPYKRVDTLVSSRHVRVMLDGMVLADSTRPTILFETGLPPRYYLPKTDVRMELLTPTSTTSGCPYKGFATYWSISTGSTVHEDLAWGYVTPLPEAAGVAGMVCFYDEKVDVEVDGDLQDRPQTKFA